VESTLPRVRGSGYATQFGPVRADIHTLAVPVFDRHGAPIAPVGLSAPAERLNVRAANRLERLTIGTVRNAEFRARSGQRSVVGPAAPPVASPATGPLLPTPGNDPGANARLRSRRSRIPVMRRTRLA
jgi:hypothetical protein